MNNSAILAIDIGNTRAKIAILNQDGEITHFQAIPSKPQIYTNDLIQVLEDLAITNIDIVLVSSVVPRNNDIIKKFTKDHLLCPIYFVERGLDLIVKEEYGATNRAGIDIVCKSSYLANLKEDVICIDSGTATVVNYVDKEGYLQKIAITIGFRGMYRGLYNDAELVQLYEPEAADKLLNTNTQTAINGGNYFGYIGLLNALAYKAKAETGAKKIYFTGGYSFMFKDVVDFDHIYDPFLLFKGLYLIYKKNKNILQQELFNHS